MLHVVTGALYSTLEGALADHLRSIRSQSPFAPLTIAVPSEHVRQRLQWALCAERGLSLFNVHVLTFFQIALRIIEEQGHTMALDFRPESFFREWIHQMLKRRAGTLPALAELAEVPGAWAALWTTIKDLKDGAVDAAFARDILKQTNQEYDAVSQSVLSLYDWYCQEQRQFQAFDGDDAAKLACGGVGSSTFLSQQEHIWYYGFYDLTQVQMDLFHAIAQRYTTSMYFPLAQDHPAYAFAQHFFDRHILGVSAGTTQVLSDGAEGTALRGLFVSDESSSKNKKDEGTSSQLKSNVDCQIYQVSSVEDEMGIVAKDILLKVEEGGVAWHEIGVVGRSLSGYQYVLPRVFREHRIPFHTTMNRSLAEFPLVQTVLRLLAIPISDFPRDQVMDVLNSPYFHLKENDSQSCTPRPDLWDRASRRLGVTKGLVEWERFVRVIKNEQATKKARNRVSKPDALTHDQIQACDEVLQVLFSALKRIPSHASYGVFVDQIQELVERFVIPPSKNNENILSSRKIWDSWEAEDISPFDDSTVHQAVLDQLQEVRRLTDISDEVSYQDFVETVERWMQNATTPLQSNSGIIDGVWVLDAMAARGFSFRVLYVVGVTEHVFPRHIQEDAFLRDPIRRFLYVNVGCKIPEKASEYEEEQLLFYLLVNSATESLTLLTQCFEQNDRSAIPSWYISEVQRCLHDLPITVVPKRGSAKYRRMPDYAGSRLTLQETRLKWMVDRCLPQGPYTDHEQGWAVVQRGIASLACQESLSPRMTRFDGLTGFLAEYWKELLSRGVSPTTLEQYAECPFKFFAKRVLRLEEADLPGVGLGPREVGILLHALLREGIASIKERQEILKSGELVPDEIVELVKIAAERVFRNYERTSPTGYPLLWEVQQEQFVRVVNQVLVQDLCSQQDDWNSLACEELVRGEVTVLLDNESHRIPLVGRIDRVDWSDSRQQSRIIDYKYKKSARSIPSPQLLARDVVRGLQLQPPLYLTLLEEGSVLSQNILKDESQDFAACAGLWLYYITPQNVDEEGVFTRVPFTQETWHLIKPQFEKTLRHLLGGIRRGAYFIAPGSHCQMCDYRAICHRTHSRTQERATADRAQTKAYRDLRYATLTMSSKAGKKTLES